MNLKLAHKLNIVHLLHFTLVLLIALLVNLVILSKAMSIKISYALAANSENINKAIDKELDDIESIAFLLAEYTFEENLQDDILINRLNQMNIYSIKLIYENDLNNLKIGWNNIKDDSLYSVLYLFPAKDEKFILLELEKSWLKNILDDIKHDPNFNYLIINHKKECLYATEEKAVDIDTNLRFYSASNVIDSLLIKKSQNAILGRINIFNPKKSRLAYAVKNESLNFYFITYFQNTFMGYMRNYFKLIIFELLIIFALMISMIIRTNARYTKSISTIVTNIFESKYISAKNITTKDEGKIIQRSIDTLQSQLDIYAKNMKKSTADSAKIEKDIQIAKRLQRNILPKSVQEIENQIAFKIYATSEAAFELGGDLYDYFMLDDKHFMFVVADIAGKGIPASLFMIFTHTLLRSIAKAEMNVAEIAEKLNNKLIEENVSDLFVTMFLGILEIDTGILTYCNAAHNLPLLIKSDGVIEEMADMHGIPIGIYPNRNYKSSQLRLNANDQLLIYTDGVVDSKDENDMNFTVDVLKYNLMGAWFSEPKDIVEKLNETIVDFRGNKFPEDDMTIMAFKYTPGKNTVES